MRLINTNQMNPKQSLAPAIEIWLHFYKHHTGEKYLFDGKQCMHLKQLMNKVKAKVQEKGMEPNDENVLNSLKMFLNTVKDPWILEHLEVSLINSKFNVLYNAAIKNNPLTIANNTAEYFAKRYSS